MTLPGKRLRPYHPRRNKKVLSIQKQEFLDCLHTLDLGAGQLIVLSKEGRVDQIQQAQIKARSIYKKYKDQLLTLAANIGESVKDRASTYLNSYHNLVESALSYDEAVFRDYYNTLLRLKALTSLKNKARSLDQDKETQSHSA